MRRASRNKALEFGIRRRFVTGGDVRRDTSIENVVPQAPPRVDGRDGLPHARPPAAEEVGQPASSGGQQRLDLLPDAPRQRRRRAPGRDGDRHRATVDNARKDHGGERRIVHRVDQYPTLPARGEGPAVDVRVVGGRNHEQMAADIGRFEFALRNAEVVLLRKFGRGIGECRRDHGHARAGIDERTGLSRRHVAAADDETGLVREVQE